MIEWHRLLGVMLTLDFAEYPLSIDMEKELSVQSQMLDLLIIKKKGVHISSRMPDGLEDLARHNLLTYKSMQESLNDWTLKELTGHYVNYRKTVDPSTKKMLPEDHFRLYAISTRYPQKLAKQSGRNWQKLQDGVYQANRGVDSIRVIVLKEIPIAEHNLIWQLFSSQAEKVQDAALHYAKSGRKIGTIVNEVLRKYQAEEINMPYTMEDFWEYQKEQAKANVKLLTLEERLSGLAPEEFWAGLSDEYKERLLKLLSREQNSGELIPNGK